MKKNYKEPNILVLDMDGEDIIATSGEIETVTTSSSNTASIISNNISDSWKSESNYDENEQ